jgi:hypothetical protein
MVFSCLYKVVNYKRAGILPEPTLKCHSWCCFRVVGQWQLSRLNFLLKKNLNNLQADFPELHWIYAFTNFPIPDHASVVIGDFFCGSGTVVLDAVLLIMQPAVPSFFNPDFSCRYFATN